MSYTAIFYSDQEIVSSVSGQTHYLQDLWWYTECDGIRNLAGISSTCLITSRITQEKTAGASQHRAEQQSAERNFEESYISKTHILYIQAWNDMLKIHASVAMWNMIKPMFQCSHTYITTKWNSFLHISQTTRADMIQHPLLKDLIVVMLGFEPWMLNLNLINYPVP